MTIDRSRQKERQPLIPRFYLPVHGILMAVGIFVGMYFADLRARQLNLDYRALSGAITWAAIAAFFISHFFDVLTYRTAEFLKTPQLLIDPRMGWSISSFGGLFGAALGLFLWRKRTRLPLSPYADALAFGTAFVWAIGRLGCFLVHDHMGRRTDFFLAVQYPGGPRHDLGLDEALFWIALCICFLILFRKRRPVGTYLMLTCFCYGPVRFLLDFLRATDVRHPDSRYFGLTPAQYGSLALIVAGIGLYMNARDIKKTSGSGLPENTEQSA